MKIIDGEKYVNKEDAFKALKKEVKRFEEKDIEYSVVISATLITFISTLFMGDEKNERNA